MGGLSLVYLALIVLLLFADVVYCWVEYSSLRDFFAAITKREVLAAFRLTMLTCTLTAVLSLWVAVPLGYLLARYRFWGSSIIDTLIDIPVVLPPLILGLSLLILFHLRVGDWSLESWFKDSLGFGITYRWPAVVLAQFSVAAAFAVRTMRLTFDQINPRTEDVARTLGCSRAQAFLTVALPQATRGMVAAGTIAWARSLGEFGPILVFAGATRMRTEVLSTTVFLELSIGNLDASVAVSLLMVAMAVCVLMVLRLLNTELR